MKWRIITTPAVALSMRPLHYDSEVGLPPFQRIKPFTQSIYKLHSIMHKILIILLIATPSLFAQVTSNNPFANVSTNQLKAELSGHLDEVRRRNFGQSQAIEAKINALAMRAIPETRAERVELAQALNVAAELIRKMKGTTPELAETLRLASELDPDDLKLARNATFEAIRQESVNKRIDEARRLNETKNNNR